ncbi:MAG: LamG domain-containing protein [Nonlabens sp.]|nr:LamG domain-containing protein [Nonlabens sp.]
MPVNDGNWHHVAAVYEPSNSSGTVALYVDGILDVRATPSTTVNTGTTERFTIGRRIDNVNFFTGSIDEVRFWNRALNPNEINTNRTVELCPSTSGLTAYFQFDQGVAGASNTGLSSVPNLVSNNNGTLTNLSLNGMVSNWVSGAPVSTLLNSDVSLNSGILSVAQTAATYQWVNCATGNIVPGATSATFAPTTVGNYAVDITLNSCTQRSSCTVVSTLGNETTSVYDIYLLQNPSQELLFTSAVLPTDRITVHTLAGSKLVESNAVQVQTFSQTLTSGIYLVTLSREAVANQVFKWVKM